MNCPNCGTENPDQANFCFNCAHNLSEAKSEPETTKFTKYIPQALMKKLEESAKLGGIENERRIVSILFCDVVGSTKHAESMDPEEWLEIMDSIFDKIIPPIYKYEGIVARFMGDAFLAFFGAPISHEDDPERAALAAIDVLEAANSYSATLQTKSGIKINLRLGINTGLVVVGEIGTDMRVEYTAMGDAINIASRMESTAEPGTIQITQDTFKHISYLFDAEKLGQVKVKGKTEPISTYKILNKKSLIDKTKKYTERQSVFIGREKELNTLNNAIDDVTADHGGIIWISGEAGIGKSRLITEFYSSLFLEDRVNLPNQHFIPNSEKYYWLETEALPYQTSSPFSPIISFFEKYFGITIEMSNQEKYELVKNGLGHIPESDDIFPYIANLLKIELSETEIYQTILFDPAILQEITLQSIVTFLDSISGSNILILVFDDIQWVDNSSFLLMQNLVNEVKTNPILLIMLSRESTPTIDQFMGKIESDYGKQYSKLELLPLSDLGTFSLISNILKIENLPQNIRDEIFRKSQGNPFYVEELVRSFIESGYLVKENDAWILTADSETLSIPESLTSLLMTRLDQLDEKSKRVAQSASVIGREFLFPILDCINDPNVILSESLSTLKQKEFIAEKIFKSDKAYFFKHVLSRDVAYNSLLFKRRKEIHAKIAHCLQNVDENLAAEIARHLFEAEEVNEAMPFLVKAAESAISTNSTSEVITMLTRVEAVSDQITDFRDIMSMHVILGTAHAMEGNIEESTKYYSELLNSSKQKQDKRGEVKALNKLAENALYFSQDVSQADEYLKQAETIGNIINFSEGLLETSAVRCVMHQSLGEFDKAAEYELKGANLGETLNNEFFNLSFRYNLIVSYTLSLRHKEARQLISDFLRQKESEGEKYFVSSIYGYLYSVVLLYAGGVEEAIKSAEKGYQLASEINAPFPKYLSARALGDLLLLTGAYEEAKRYFEICVEQSTKSSKLGFFATSKLSLATAKLALGENDPILIEEGKNDLEVAGGTYWGAKSWGELGYYYYAVNNYVEARKYFDYALTKHNAAYFIYKPLNLIGKAKVSIAENLYDEAFELIEEVTSYCEEYNIKIYVPEIDFLRLKLEHLRNGKQISDAELDKIAEEANNLKLKPLMLDILKFKDDLSKY